MNKILMVEEEVRTVAKAQERLSHSGFEMFSAFDGHHGFQIAKNKIPDLIITDATMPVMSGFEFCKAIQLDEDTKSIPIIVMTEKHRMEDSFIFLGIKDFLSKPISMDELEGAVRKRLTLSNNMQMLKTKILINGRAEILSCCQQLLKDNTQWGEYYTYNNDTLLRDAIKYSPDVILIDLLMPGETADEMIKKLKSVPELKNTVILTYYTSASTSRDPFAAQAQMIEVQYMKRMTAEAGAKEYLGPFNPVTFLNLIDIYRREFNFII